MDQILDSPIKQPVEHHVTYAGFWPRLGAIFLDGLVIGIPTFALTYFNVVSWKSSGLLILVSIIGTVYKPFMEFQYGATLGKMALNLRVVNLDLQKPTITEILLRNIFNIATNFLSIVSTFIIFNSSEFQTVTGYMQFNAILASQSGSTVIRGVTALIGLVEFICLVSDKQSRALHDRIGKTYVIVKTTDTM